MSHVIVDTSIWSLVLRRRAKNLGTAEQKIVRDLREMIIDGRAVMLGVVRQDLLTGIADPNMFESARSYLREFDDIPPDLDDYERAADFADQCRSRGVATTPVDMLICSVAAGRDLPVFTSDRDFELYCRNLPVQNFLKR